MWSAGEAAYAERREVLIVLRSARAERPGLKAQDRHMSVRHPRGEIGRSCERGCGAAEPPIGLTARREKAPKAVAAGICDVQPALPGCRCRRSVRSTKRNRTVGRLMCSPATLRRSCFPG